MNIFSQRQRLPMALLAGLVFAAALPARGQAASTIDVPKIDITDFTLPNGLRVLLHEDHTSPTVAFNLWYNAGGKFDPKGKTGLAHMFEHMMDEGTLNMPNGEFKRVVQSAGGSYSAATQNDFVQYTLVMPSNQFETALWLEAERMANLSPTLDSTRFNLERDAVRNEFRDRIVNSAPMSVAVAMIAALFPEGAYAPPLFGYPADIASATVEDLRRFYETYYVPNNAVLAIAGDFTSADARKKIEKHFGPIPRGRPVTFPRSVTPLHGETRLVVEHPSGVRGVWVAWRSAKSAAPDRPAAMALSSILTQRLRRVLVDERRAAIILNPIYNQSYDQEEAGIFQVAMTPNATAPATMFEEVMDSVIASIRTNGVTDAEVRRWVASYRMQMLSGMQSYLSISSNLAEATITQKNPMGMYDLLARAQRLTPADVQAAARKYLTGDRVVVSLVPAGKLDLISKPNLPYVNATRKDP